MTLILPSTKLSPADTMFLFRASDCIDEEGMFARSFGRKLRAAFSRGSRKVVSDSRGVLIQLPNDAPSLSWCGGEQVVLLGGPRTNLFLRSQEFESATWLKSAAGAGSNPSVTANAGVAPDGTTTADRVQFATNGSTTADRSILRQSVTVTAADYAMTFWVRSNTGLTYTLVFHWEGGSIGSFSVTPTWSRVSLSRAAAAATSLFGIEARGATNGSSETADILLWQGQLELGGVESSEIKTEGTTVTRNADWCYFDVPGLNPPRAMTLYQRSVNVGQYNALGSTHYLLRVGSSSTVADPRLAIYSSVSGQEGALYDDGVAQVTSAAALFAQALGDVVEQRCAFSGTTVTGGAALNGGDESVAATSAATGRSDAWSAPRLYLTDGGALVAYTHIAVAAGERSLDEMRALAGV